MKGFENLFKDFLGATVLAFFRDLNPPFCKVVIFILPDIH